MGLTDERKAKRTKLSVRAAKDPGPEGAIAKEAVERMDAEDAERLAASRRRGARPKPKPEPVLTEDEKREYALTTLGPLQQALAAATAAGDINALKDVAAMASALKAGARARGMGIVSENQAAEVIIRAERSMGQVLISLAESGTYGRGVAGGLRHGPESKTAQQVADGTLLTLEGMGLKAHEAFRFRLLGALSAEEFEALLDAKRDSEERIAKVDFYRAATPVEPQQSSVAKQARKNLREALHSEDDIPQVVAWLAATDALITLTDAIPIAELSAVGQKATEFVAWFNAQKSKRS